MSALGVAIASLVALLASAGAAPALPIPQDPTDPQLPVFVGRPATPHPIRAVLPPRHPFMAPNGRSNLHNDAYQSDTYRQAGPLGHATTEVTTELLHECASLTFDSHGRVVSVCVGLEGPAVVAMFDPRNLDLLAMFPLPPRLPGTGVFTDFSGGGYF